MIDMETLRMCYIRKPGVLTAISDRKDSNDPWFEGILTSIASSSLEKLDKYFNVSLISENIIGTLKDPISMTYDGCIGNLQRNESDTALVLISSPVIGPNITQEFPLSAGQIVMLSPYNPVVEIVDTDVMYAFNCFPGYIWSAVTITAVVLLVVTIRETLQEAKAKAKQKIRSINDLRRPKRRFHSIYYECIMFLGSRILKQPAPYSVSRIPLILITIFCFLIHCYFTSLIKTELAVVKKPVTLDTYDDILNNDEVLPVWFGSFPHYMLFKYAASGTKERMIWDKAIRMNNGTISRSLFVTNRAAGSNPEASSYADVLPVLLDSIVTKYTTRSNVCAYTSNLEKGSPLMHSAVDPKSRETVIVFPINDRLDMGRRGVLHRRQTWIFEAGFLITEKMRTGLLMPISNREQYTSCMSDELVLPESGISSPGYKYYEHLFLLASIFLCTAFVIFVVEIALTRGLQRKTQATNYCRRSVVMSPSWRRTRCYNNRL